MTMVGAAAILPLPPTKDTRVRQSMRGVAAFTKPRVLSEPSARQPQVSTIPPAGAQQGYPSWVCRKHLEWVEKEVARRVAAALALALSKGENAPTTARARVPYKDAGTQVDAVIPIASASGGAEDDCFLIKKEVLAPFQKLSISLSYSLSFCFPNEPNGDGEVSFLFKANLLTFHFSRKKEKNTDGG